MTSPPIHLLATEQRHGGPSEDPVACGRTRQRQASTALSGTFHWKSLHPGTPSIAGRQEIACIRGASSTNMRSKAGCEEDLRMLSYYSRIYLQIT